MNSYMAGWSTSWNQDCWGKISNLTYTDDTTLMAEIEELKSLLMTVKEESEKAGLKLIIQKTKIMASSAWGGSGNSERLFFWAPKSLQVMTATMKLKDACSLEEKFLNMHNVFKPCGLSFPFFRCFWWLIQSPYCSVGWFGLSLCLSFLSW